MPPHLSWHPFAALNLLRNPFGELTNGDRVRAAVVDIEEAVEWLGGSQAHVALQYLGECGRGKSTHLRSIAARFPDSAYVYLPADEPCPPIPGGRPLLIDEAQRLPWWQRRQALGRGVPLVLGTHRDLSRALRRARYTVRTIYLGDDLSAAQLAKMLNRRIDLARLSDAPVPTISDQRAARLLGIHGSDVRAIEHTLFDEFQRIIFSQTQSNP